VERLKTEKARRSILEKEQQVHLETQNDDLGDPPAIF